MSVLAFRRNLMVPSRFYWDRYDGSGNYVDTVESNTFDYPYDGGLNGYHYRMTRGSPPMITWGVYDAVPIYGYEEVNNGRKSITIGADTQYTYGTRYTFDKVSGKYTVKGGSNTYGRYAFTASEGGGGGTITLDSYASGSVDNIVEDTIVLSSSYSVAGGVPSISGGTTYSASSITQSVVGKYFVQYGVLCKVTGVTKYLSSAELSYTSMTISSLLSGKYFIRTSDPTKLYNGYSQSDTYKGTATERGIRQTSEIVGYKKGSTKNGTTSSPNPDAYPNNGRDASSGYWFLKESEAPYQFDDRDMGV